MNKKQLTVTSVLVSLIFILVIAQSFFSENFENASINTENSKSVEYKINDDKYSISIPSKWLVQEENSEDSYISRVIRFRGEEEKITGIMQVVNTKNDVAVFANNDFKKQSLKYNDSQFSLYNNNDNQGVLVKYNTSIKNGYKYKNECYYIKLSENQIVKVLFNIRDDSNITKNNSVCNEIISSIKQNK